MYREFWLGFVLVHWSRVCYTLSLVCCQEGISKLCYLCDIFERLNTLNLSLQGKESNIMDFVDKLSAFQAMLDLWGKKIYAGRMAMFSHLSSYIEDCENSISEALQNDIGLHLQSLKDEF